MCEFRYKAPTTLVALLETLDSNGPGVQLLAGGTDLLVNIRNGLCRPELVVDIKKVEGFDRIAWDGHDGLFIGPAVTIHDLLCGDEVRERYPLLLECAKDLASYQVRNRATVIGNIVNASPCSDMAPALLCLDATVSIASSQGTRTVAISQFFTGVKKTVLRQDEVVTGIAVPPETAGAKGLYRKLKRIQGHDLGIVGVAVALVSGSIRIAVSSSAPTPVATGPLPADMPAEDVVGRVMAVVSPISDVRCSQEYRRFMVAEFTRRLLAEVRS